MNAIDPNIKQLKIYVKKVEYHRVNRKMPSGVFMECTVRIIRARIRTEAQPIQEGMIVPLTLHHNKTGKTEKLLARIVEVSKNTQSKIINPFEMVSCVMEVLGD